MSVRTTPQTNAREPDGLIVGNMTTPPLGMEDWGSAVLRGYGHWHSGPVGHNQAVIHEVAAE